jgi:hypothetical protein
MELIFNLDLDLVVLSGSLTASAISNNYSINGGKLELRDSHLHTLVGNYIDVQDGFLTAKDFTTVRLELRLCRYSKSTYYF